MVRRALVVAFAVALMGAADAHACSCAYKSPRQALRQADHAFTGRIVDIDRRGVRAVFTIRVRRELKGDFGRRVRVHTNRDEAACGLSGRVGDRLGLIVERERGGWLGYLCGQYGARQLERAAKRLRGAGSAGGSRPCAG
jgi:hypothetical protein